ncbi:hypothetical protein [Nonomuraea sp. NPDC003709]|uniref:hypothetical protein n=1 Tax=Nonomuraea sp. NPDC003709 TaxID=3154450 RepID=UPI00339DBED5
MEDAAEPVSSAYVQVDGPAARIVQIHHQVLYRLGDPVRAWVCRGPQHADAPGGVLDDGQDVLALPVQGDGFDEITGRQDVGLRTQEVGPAGGRPLGRRIKTWLLEGLPDRGLPP